MLDQDWLTITILTCTANGLDPKREKAADRGCKAAWSPFLEGLVERRSSLSAGLRFAACHCVENIRGGYLPGMRIDL
jgi:hypothetical protein